MLRLPKLLLNNSVRNPFLLFVNRKFSLDRNIFDFNEEVTHAISEDRPIVALESTIISHGLPYPHNLQTAKDVENIIRENGAVPATIAILRGRLTVGLSEAQLLELSNVADSNVKILKTSRRDLSYVVGSGLNGATTVSGTIVVANSVGIPIFVTGGIGGVHRLGQETMDISADLTELGRNRICVVSSGVKSILDISRTLEYLETQGVTVTSFANGGEFPAFYTRRSGHAAPYDVADETQVARMIAAAEQLQLSSGMLVAVPVPESYAMEESTIEEAIKQSLADADKKGVKGKNVTPHVLAALTRVTQGKSLQTNMALVKNNASIGAKIAVALKKLKFEGKVCKPYIDRAAPYFRDGGSNIDMHQHSGGSSSDTLRPVVVGGSNVDLSYHVTEPEIKV